MNNEEAIAVLEGELARFRDSSYDELVDRMETGSIHVERDGGRRARYQVEIEIFWDSVPGGNIRVMGSIGNGGWRAFVPLCRDLIKAPNGSFIGE